MNMDDKAKNNKEKKPYRKPVLVLYGSVPELTKGGTGDQKENTGNPALDKKP